MRTKIIGILVCLMLMTAFLTTAQNVENIKVKDESEEIEPISFNQVGVPIWEVGDKFTYKIDKFSIEFEEENINLSWDLKIDELPLEVVEVTEDYYTLSFKFFINGSFLLIFNLGDGPIKILFEYKATIIPTAMAVDRYA